MRLFPQLRFLAEPARSRGTLGVIGLGQMSTENHLPLLVELGLKPIWYLDSNLRKCKDISRLYGGNYWPPSKPLAELATPEVLLIASPYGTRQPYYEQLSEIWPTTAIYIEKPLALTSLEHDKIAAIRPPWLIASGYNKRSMGLVRFIKRIIDSRIFGRLEECCITFGGIGIKTGGRYLSNLQLAGGGVLFEVVVHYIDAVNFILCASSPDVHEVHMDFDDGFDVATQATYSVTTAEGNIPCKLNVSILENIGEHIEFKLQTAKITASLFAEKLTITSPDPSFKLPISLPIEYTLPRMGTSSVAAYWQQFLAGVTQRTPNYTSIINSKMTTEIIEKLYTGGGRALCSK